MGGNISWAPYLVNVQGNGPLGVALDYGASLTLIGGVTIADHTTAGVSLYGNSQAAIYNSNQIVHNGTGTDSDRAGIRVTNGSQALVSTASIQNNGGPGILGLLHATLDVEASTLSSNAGGAIVCDQSTAIETDLPHSALGSASACTVSSPGNQQARGSANMNLGLPNWQGIKVHSIALNRVITSHHTNVSPPVK